MLRSPGQWAPGLPVSHCEAQTALRSEWVHGILVMKVQVSVPIFTARIGPPKVYLEAEDKAIAINISPPGAEDSIMWQQENPQYSVIIWRNMSGAQVSAALARVPWRLTP